MAFAGGTISATGGALAQIAGTFNVPRAGAANGGQGAQMTGTESASGSARVVNLTGGDGAEIVAGAAVTPAASITVTVGAGGTAGTGGAAGGSGYVWIEYVKP